MAQLPYWIWLTTRKRLTLRGQQLALSYFGTPEEIYRARHSDIEQVQGLTDKEVAALGGHERNAHHGHVAVPIVDGGDPAAIFVLHSLGGQHAFPMELVDLIGNGGRDLLHHGHGQ